MKSIDYSVAESKLTSQRKRLLKISVESINLAEVRFLFSNLTLKALRTQTTFEGFKKKLKIIQKHEEVLFKVLKIKKM